MPVNRNALVRYRTIDKCLQNRRRKWTINDLIAACSEALYELTGGDKDVSMRTIRLDINSMRSSQLGYNAPIIVTDKKYYSYEDADYSITNIPLTSQDLDILQDVAHLLRQFSGFSHFNDVSELVHKLEDKVYSEQHQQAPVIDFEKNELLMGLQWQDVLYKSIIRKTVIAIQYQSFKARSANEMICSPYLLKEFNNRWFLLCRVRAKKQVLTLALDRMLDIRLLTDEKFVQDKNFDPHTYFKDIVGVTRNAAEGPTHIRFFANHVHAPYIRTKPLHASQQIIEKRDGGIEFSIDVIPNYELERLLLGFGDGLQVISPNSLVRTMKKIAKGMLEKYETST